MMKKSYYPAIMLFMLSSNCTFAEQGTAIHLYATIASAPNCALVASAETAFVNIKTNDIESPDAKQKITYTLSCITNEKLTFKIIGNGAGFDSTVLKTSNPNLAIKILADGKPWNINSELPIDQHAPPTLEASLVSKKNAELASGPFSGSATLIVDLK